MTVDYRVGDVFERLAEIPDGSVDLVLTSPPFLALRSYLPADHPDKSREIGSEPTPAEFIDTLLRLTAEWRRVLAPHGSICVELGDTYAGSGGAGGDYNPGGRRVGQEKFDGSSRRDEASTHKYAGEWANPGYGDGFKGGNPGGQGWPLAKSLCGVPHLYHLSLAYGRNLLTGEPSPAGQWRVRNVVAWCRPNPPVGALGDKFRPATSYMTVACVSDKRWFDLDAVRGEHRYPDRLKDPVRPARDDSAMSMMSSHDIGHRGNPAGAPPLDWWEIPTQPYAGSHYATWPEALCARPILAMCPERVCRTCGEPSRRVVEVEQKVVTHGHYFNRGREGQRVEPRPENGKVSGRRQSDDDVAQRPGNHQGFVREAITLGWTDCGHNDDWRPGIVLDPFAGSGTTLRVANRLGRDAIGIDLDSRNVALALERVGDALTSDHDAFRAARADRDTGTLFEMLE